MSASELAPVLYVLTRFPRPSEACVVREVLAREARGERVLVAALLPAEEGTRHPELDRLRAPVHLLPRYPTLRDPRVARSHLWVAARAPGRWLALARRAAGDPAAWRRFLQSGIVAERLWRERVGHVHAHGATAAAVVARGAAALTDVPVTVTGTAEDALHRDDAADGWPGPPTVPTPRVEAAPPREATGTESLLCVLRSVPEQGVDTLLAAFGLLADDRPGLHLEVICEVIGDGPLDADLRSRARALGLDDRVHFRGPLPAADVRTALSGCTVLVLPRSVDESDDPDGASTVLREAVACGVPVVATGVDSLLEQVHGDATALQVPRDDPVQLAVGIATLLDRPARGRAGRAHRPAACPEDGPARRRRRCSDADR